MGFVLHQWLTKAVLLAATGTFLMLPSLCFAAAATDRRSQPPTRTLRIPNEDYESKSSMQRHSSALGRPDPTQQPSAALCFPQGQWLLPTSKLGR